VKSETVLVRVGRDGVALFRGQTANRRQEGSPAPRGWLRLCCGGALCSCCTGPCLTEGEARLPPSDACSVDWLFSVRQHARFAGMRQTGTA
jgi:hypothetical protein